MSKILYGVLILLTAAGISYVLTPLSAKIAVGIGAMDIPKDNRRMHTRPIPRLGGLAISTAVLFTTGALLTPTPALRAVWIGGSVITLVGILDDVRPLKPLLKLAGQLLAAGLAVECGAVIDSVSFFGETLLLGKLSAPITVFWILLLTNAINLIDGLDGLCCGISAISALSLFVITAIMDEQVCAYTAVAIFGGCAGFYPYNRYPAKIFAGDTGAQYLGFVLAVVTVDGMFKLPLFLSVFLPPLIFLFPLSDTIFAVVRRLAHGQSPFHADKGHVHHRLLSVGFSHKQTVALLHFASVLCGCAALMVFGHGIYLFALLLLLFVLWRLYCVVGKIMRKHRQDLGVPKKRCGNLHRKEK